METLIIGKPAMNVYLPLKEYPHEGDIFMVKGKNESVGNVGATAACLLSKWGMHAHFTGVVGNDAYADKIRDTFREYKVNSKYIETQFESGTSVNYIILNTTTGFTTKILYNNPDVQLAKFKYDFTPSGAIMDGTDIAGINAVLNNSRNCKTILFCRYSSEARELIEKAKRCNYVICNQAFATFATKVSIDGNKDSYFELYQKIVDTFGHSNFIVILDNHKILYSLNGQVKLLPEMKINVADYSSFESVFTGAFSFGILNGLVLDDSIKLANTAAAISISKIGEVASIPTIDEVLENTGLRDKLLEAKARVEKEEAENKDKDTGASRMGYGGINTSHIAEAQARDAAAEAQLQVQAQAEVSTQQEATPSAFAYAPVQESTQPIQSEIPQVKQETNMFDKPSNV